MTTAIFNANLTFTPPASNTVAQAFNVQIPYSAVSLGTISVAKASVAEIDVPFGGATSAQGLVVRNDLDVAVMVRINGSIDAKQDGGALGLDLYEVSPGGMMMHWSPKTVTTGLARIRIKPSGTGPTVDGTVEYIVLGG
jgi:hypothetical protein